ncbi:MAG: hypothetical protein MAG551_02588 [Candidatus Scalindua arabica]|uniref:Uncharacterized protein n=1 Tax=Candidatus Scalindua arabica TaxID=1127984 RepID=A0A942A3W6_9BACT|nr:hypothetical protein [Candidatus Scalindua arabica]
MGWINKEQARQMLEDESLVDEIVAAVVSDKKVLQELAEDVADELEDILEDDPTFRGKVIEVASADPAFKKSVTEELIAQMAD